MELDDRVAERAAGSAPALRSTEMPSTESNSVCPWLGEFRLRRIPSSILPMSLITEGPTLSDDEGSRSLRGPRPAHADGREPSCVARSKRAAASLRSPVPSCSDSMPPD